MKKKEILVLIGEVLGSRVVYSVASLVITITMLSGITIILRNDIRDIKSYVQSVVDGDPNYKEIHSQVSGNENVIRGNIDVEAFLAKDGEKKEETLSTANNISSGYDNYTPTQTVNDESSNKPSNGVDNSTGGGTTVADYNSNNSNSNNAINSGNDSNNNSNESKKEEVLDRSSFNGKDIMISEGEPFNPMNGLQLAATDINGKNITSKIVIKENNVDTYKPGLYTVKATVELSDKSNLEKEFFVRVEPTVLNLAVNDVRVSKDILEKNEEFNLSFSVKSSKSYLEVASVNINNKDYTVKKTSSSSFFRKSNKYEVDLVAPSKGGLEKIQIKSVTMSDGTIVDVDKNVEVEVLREEAQITDVAIKNISNENISLEYKLEDIDDTIEKAVFYLYNENNIIIQREELEKNNKSYIDLNINENGKYKVEVKGYYKENLETISDLYKEKELFSQSLEVKKFNDDNVISDQNDIISKEELMLMSMEDEEYYNSYIEIDRNISEKERTNTSIIGLDEEKTHQIKITGNITDNLGYIVPGTVSVTVPTSANFQVTQDGNLISAQMEITSESDEGVEVIASKFVDANGSDSINLVKKTEFSSNSERKDVWLKLTGGIQEVAFTSEENGKMYKGDYSEITNIDGCVLGTVTKDLPLTLSLKGEGGTNGTNNSPIQNNFKLVLKIKKSK